MEKQLFIESLNNAFVTANKMAAVKIMLDLKLVGNLKESKFFIDDYWFPTKEHPTAGENVYYNLPLESKAKLF